MKRFRTGIVTVPIFKSGNHPLANLLDILIPHSKYLCLITGNDGYRFFRNDHRFRVDGWIYPDAGRSTGVRLFLYIWTQLAVSSRLIIRGKNVDTWIFFFGFYRLTLPVLISKLLNKRVLLLLPDSFGRLSGKSPHGPVSLFMQAQLKLIFTLSDRIVIYSPRFIGEWGLEPYRNKILIGHEHFLDADTFRITTPFCHRSQVIGFIGRFSSEKGIREFVRALPALLIKWHDLTVLIGGDGPLKDEIGKYLLEHNFTDRIKFIGWIKHDHLPQYLNQLRLLVIPSTSEGLPNIILEAMACGTPVLANPVGAIPDFICDGVTGFILENNTPECIAAGITRAINSPDLKKIIENGQIYVCENYQFEKTVENWRRILEKTGQNTT